MANMRIFQGEYFEKETPDIRTYRNFIGVWDDDHPEIIIAEVINGEIVFFLFDELDNRLEEMGFKTSITYTNNFCNAKHIAINFKPSEQGAIIS